MSTYVLTLSDLLATLENVGGKGMSLAKLTRAGLPVPDEVHITTEAYRRFVAENGFQPRILEALQGIDVTDPTTLEPISRTIGSFFAAGTIPADIAQAISAALPALKGVPVAVRSSATAEDLPGASFAGQQDSYLNIQGEEAVLEAVKQCWASLWTARAIAYRARQGIAPDEVALAVVVQELVFADAAGVLFTANPINGKRAESMITATWGLGEAIVGGAVTPDTLVVDKTTGKVLRRETADKQVMTVRSETGTREVPVPEAQKRSAVLTDAQAAELARLGRTIEQLYGMPMDIEWTWTTAEGFAIVQARPITALPIDWTPPDPKGVYMRGGVADLTPNPLSPLFTTWAIPNMVKQMFPVGERLMHTRPVWQDDYYTTINNYAYMDAAISPQAWWWVLTGMLPAYPGLLRRLVPIWRDILHPEYQALVAPYQDKKPETMAPGELWQDAQGLLDGAMYYTCGLMFATMGASAGSEGLLTQAYNKLAKREGDPEAACLLIGWDNIPMRAEKFIYDIARWCRERPDLAAYLQATASDQLAGQLEQVQAPGGVELTTWQELQQRLEEYKREFGHIIFQLDFAAPLPLDDITPMVETIKMYLRGEGANPYERQRASEARRIQIAETMRSRLKGLKRWLFNQALKIGWAMAAVREDALAEIGLGYPMLRAMLRELGGRFAQAGAIEQAEDIFWLEAAEVQDSVHKLEQGQALSELTAQVAERKAYDKRLRQETPPPMIPMKKKYMGFDTSIWIAESDINRTGSVLKGVAASSGKVTAPACVLDGPEDFGKMRPGAVLISGTTTPAWTPLFAMAAAVVTDIGGPLSHGSIVAREYNIPAVMGTGVATRRIRDGQTITVDGSEGTVELK